jgi:hypothetical protein
MTVTQKKGGPRRSGDRSGDMIFGYAGTWGPLFEKKSVARATAARVLSGVSEGVKRANTTGQLVRVTYVIRPTNDVPQIELEEVAPQAKDALTEALEAAKLRGAARVAEILKGPEMLSADEFAEEIGATRETVNRKRKRHEVLGLQGAKRGLRFPKWQISGDGELIHGLPELFGALDGHPWSVFRFLIREHDALNGRTGLDALRKGQLDQVIEAVQSSSRGDFS